VNSTINPLDTIISAGRQCVGVLDGGQCACQTSKAPRARAVAAANDSPIIRNLGVSLGLTNNQEIGMQAYWFFLTDGNDKRKTLIKAEDIEFARMSAAWWFEGTRWGWRVAAAT
jgi:hypothetical protein